MTKKILFYSFLALIAGIAFVGCEKKQTYTAPVISELTITPNPCEPGASVTVTLNYTSAGDNWYFDTQSFTMCDSIKPSIDSKNLIGRAGPYEQPYCQFVAPTTPGSYKVAFEGQITKTATAPDESLWGERIVRSATLVVR